MCAMDHGARGLVILGGGERGGEDLAKRLVGGGGGEGRVLGPVSLEVSVIFEGIIEQLQAELERLVCGPIPRVDHGPRVTLIDDEIKI